MVSKREIVHHPEHITNSLPSILSKIAKRQLIKDFITVTDILNIPDHTEVYALTTDGFSKDYKWKLRIGDTAYFLRCCRGVELESLKKQIAFTTFLSDNSFPAPTNFSLSGEMQLETPSGYWIMTEYIDGDVPKWPQVLEDKDLSTAAVLLAKLHRYSRKYIEQQAVDFKPPTEHLDKSQYISTYTAIQNRIASMPKPNDEDLSIYEMLERKKDTLHSFPNQINRFITQQEKIYIHGDFHAANMAFDQDREIIGLFDWEYADYWMRVAEVHMAICMLCKTATSNHFNTPINFDKARTFFQTYQHELPLDSTELAILPAIAKLDAYRLDFELSLKYIHEDPRHSQLMPSDYSHWFWWENNYQKYLDSIM